MSEGRRAQPDPARRRLLLALLLGGVAGCTVPLGPVSHHDDAKDWFDDLFGSGAGMTRFGTAYLEAHPHENDPNLLFDALTGSDPGAVALSDPAAARAALERAIRSEYRTGEVVAVAGWLLSRSEARLYALSTLV